MSIAAIYARYSTDLQREASIEDQVRICRERADREGWHVLQCYSDQALSGANLLRPGLQDLMRDALAGRFSIILIESLDRLSRDLAHVADLFKRLSFADVRIVSLTEGDIGDMHVGLKGTMGQLYLKDLASKTRRGLRGRVEQGKSGGGNSYGYDVVVQFAPNGERERGDRTINEAEAAIVRRIFTDYANGKSPRAIAKQLNTECIPGPSHRSWGPSTINGNRKRGTGVLNNEIYIGRLVWNRLRYLKDPDTDKRVSRPNPESEWIIHEVPELRIVDQPLWDAVKARQDSIETNPFSDKEPEFWDRRRPRYLLSGLMACGVCGGGIVNLNADRVGCANARNKGTCENRTTIRRDVVEQTILRALQDKLMDPRLTEIFCAEYTAHRNRLAAARSARHEADRTRLVRVTKEIETLIQALLDGVPGAQLKDKIGGLETEKAVLETKLRDAPDESIRIHPGMAQVYRSRIADLRRALTEDGHRDEAMDRLRTLIEKIVLTPIADGGRTRYEIDLLGDLAGILGLAVKADKPLHGSDLAEESTKVVAGTRNRFDRPDEPGKESTKMVAGVGFEPTTFRL